LVAELRRLYDFKYRPTLNSALALNQF